MRLNRYEYDAVGVSLIIVGLILFSLSTAGLLPMSMDVSTFTKNSANPILRPGPSGSWDSLDVAHPAVIFKDGQFMMWYCGQSASTWSIGLATSPDGVTFTKYVGNPVLRPDKSYDIYTAFVPEVIFEGGKFKMWYGAYGDGYHVRTAYAESSDGISWTKFGVVMDIGATGAWDDNHAYAATVVQHEGVYYLMYYGLRSSEPAKGRIGLATSTDGINWNKYALNPVLDLIPGTWEANDLGAHDNKFYEGMWRLWYGACGADLHKRIGYAYSSDSVVWTRYAANPVLDVGVAGSWDDDWVTAPIVHIASDGKAFMFYEGRNSAIHYQIGLATAVFAPPPKYTLTISTTVGGTTIPSTGSYVYSEGDFASVTAYPSGAYYFSHWQVDGVNVGATNPISILMDKSHNLQAIFSSAPPIKYSLTISSGSEGTTVPAPGAYTYVTGTTLPVTAYPSEGYYFHHWVLDGVDRSENPINVVMDRTHSLTAVFSTTPPPPISGSTLQIGGIVCAVAGVVVIAKSEYDYRKNVPRKKMRSK